MEFFFKNLASIKKTTKKNFSALKDKKHIEEIGKFNQIFQTFSQILKYQGIWISSFHLAGKLFGPILKSTVVNRLINFLRIGQ